MLKKISSALLPLVLLAGCGDSETTGADAKAIGFDANPKFDANPHVDANPHGDANPDFSVSDGLVMVQAIATQMYLRGDFYDGPTPAFLHEVDRIGYCRLMTYVPSFCDPGCSGFDVCINGTCESYPERLDRGALDWTWPGGMMSVEPNEGLVYSANDDRSGHGEVSLTVQGQTLRVATGEPPAPIGDWSEDVANRNGDATLRWSNPTEGARLKLHMTDCTGSHGGFGEADIFCEAPDTGELVIPGSFLAAFDEADWSRGECGLHEVIRYQADTSSNDDFRLESHARAYLSYHPRRPSF